MNKNKYCTPEIRIIDLPATDIIVTSNQSTTNIHDYPYTEPYEAPPIKGN